MKKRIVKLDLDQILNDYRLIGVISPARDYLLAHFMGCRFHLAFERQADIEWTEGKRSSPATFSQFSAQIASEDQWVYLVANKAAGSSFLPSQRAFDYLLLLDPGGEESMGLNLIEAVGSLVQVQKCVFIEISQLKERERLTAFNR